VRPEAGIEGPGLAHSRESYRWRLERKRETEAFEIPSAFESSPRVQPASAACSNAAE
jgi:hypothetical protein